VTTDISLGNQRLLQLADILDTADERHRERGEPGYCQYYHVHACGAPSCAIGEWAAANPQTWKLTGFGPVSRVDGSRINHARSEFAIDIDQYDELFGYDGCKRAKSAKDAATYIRAFVARRQS
jgi:hypothetical protein